MLEYRLDDLHWEEFERLCQSLLKANLGIGVEAWGGTGDWGNDAYCTAPLLYPGQTLQEGPFQFQVKFVAGANAAGAEPRTPLLAAVRREAQRLQERNQPSPRIYSLLTNVVLSAQLRRDVEATIRQAIPPRALVIVHGGGDICSWLHMHPPILRMFPQLLSYRDLAELVRQSFGHPDLATKAPALPARPSDPLTSAIAAARLASRKHDVDSALRLWAEVRQRAHDEGLAAEGIRAQMEVALLLGRDDGDIAGAKKLMDQCLREAQGIDLRDRRSRLLQLLGEMYRLDGKFDHARGFATGALEHARASGSPLDEGFALLSLSAVTHGSSDDPHNVKALELIELAYTAFSRAYAVAEIDDRPAVKDGFAQCHAWRAEIFGRARPDDSLVEWTRALDIFIELGDGWNWDVADTLRRRGSLRGHIGESELAAADLDRAAGIFQALNGTTGLAACYADVGELLDALGRRQEALGPYQEASLLATAFRNRSRAAYFHFRYACKLLELGNYHTAEGILAPLATSPDLTGEAHLTVISQLCTLADATRDADKLKRWCALALPLLDRAIDAAWSGDERRRLLIKKGCQLEQGERYKEARECFDQAIARCDASGDQEGLIECWFQVRGLMQRLGDRDGEREASDRVLAFGAETLNPMLAALTLVGLAQLNLRDQRYPEASGQLERALELAPDNPVVRMIATDLHAKLPRLSPARVDGPEALSPAPQRGLDGLIRELRDWCRFCPEKQEAILAVWYFIHRVDLWSISRSRVGVKFLICTAELARFQHIERSMIKHGDLFAWGTNFDLVTSVPKNASGLQQVPVPAGFLYPAGTHVLAPGDSSGTGGGRRSTQRGSRDRGRLLTPVDGPPDQSYYLAYMAKLDGSAGVSPFFVGRKQIWRRPSILKFMLYSGNRGLPNGSSLCLPVDEGHTAPSLLRIMGLAFEHGMIPVFRQRLPHSGKVRSACDSSLELPVGSDVRVTVVKQAWAQLLATCGEDPRFSILRFAQKMTALLSARPAERLPVTLYALQFTVGATERIHPALVLRRAERPGTEAERERQRQNDGDKA